MQIEIHRNKIRQGGICLKKHIVFALALTCILALTGCNNRSMNYIIEHEPSVAGIVEEVRDNSILIYIETDAYPYGAECSVSLDVENTDSYTDLSVGDEVVVYYNGEVAESDPLNESKAIKTVIKNSLRNRTNALK